jgi:hypothetical protein
MTVVYDEACQERAERAKEILDAEMAKLKPAHRESIASWFRVIDQTTGDPLPNLERAICDIYIIGKSEPQQHWPILDDAIEHLIWTAGALEHISEIETRVHLRLGPELIINESNPTETARELAKLIAQRDDILFNGFAPVRIAIEADELPRAIEVLPEALRMYAYKICRPVKVHKKQRIPAALRNDIALLYLNGLEGEWGLRAFRGITTAPVLRDDGSVRITSGFDHDTGLWCHNVPELQIPERPTQEEALSAMLSLRQFFQTFPFADGARIMDSVLGVEITDLSKSPALDESTFLVALLTAVCRASLELAPGMMVRAPGYSGAGTGKGLAIKAMCIVASGARPAAFTSGHDADELDKRLTAALIEARPAVFLDNFNAKELKSDTLASALTEYPAMVRPMGHTKMVPLHTRTFIGITGNAVEIAEDMARRILVTNFDAHMENPEQRKFAEGFLNDVLVARSRLLTAALTIWRWGRQANLSPGRLLLGKSLGSYEQWAERCRDPLMALGCRDPIDRLDEIKASDPKRRALVTFFDAWQVAHGDIVIKATDLANEVIALMPIAERKDGGAPSRQVVAGFLSRHAGTRVGGYFLEQIKDDKHARPITHYKLSRGQPACFA